MIQYRSEIDGLRAIAVLSVILFHAGFGFIPGGYVGVDIFFVISGFLITSIIIREAREGEFSYAGFYERRIRRLLPPLIPILAVSLILSFLLLNPSQFSEFVNSCYSVAAFVANWFFLSTVDYFDGPGEVTPLLHTWSLAVEEQFYFIFPVLIVFLAVRKKFIGVSIYAALTMASLGYSAYLISQSNADAAFYNSAARFWELMIGSMLAAWNPARPKQKIADIAEFVGFTLIGCALFLFDKQTVFPGFSAVLPTIGAALIIFASGNGRVFSQVLKSRPMIWIGLVSYSLYLWHWPVIVFTKLINPGAGTSLMVLGLLVSITLSIFSYHYVEKPFRKKRVISSRKSAFGFASALIVTVFCVAGIVGSEKIEEHRVEVFAKVRSLLFSGDKATVVAEIESELDFYKRNLNKNYSGNLSVYDLKSYSGWTCSFDQGNTVDRIFTCVKAQEKERNVLILGDSIARDTMHSLRRAYPDLNFIMIHQSSCPPADVGARCFRNSRELLARIGKESKFEAVIINFRYRPKEWLDVESGIDAAKQVSQNVLMFGVSPMFAQPTSDYIKSLPESSPIPVFISAKDTKLTQWDYSDLAVQAKTMAEKHGIKFVPVLDFFCPSGKCRMWVDNRPGAPLFIDQQHLTNKGMDEYGAFLKGLEQVRSLL